MLSVRTIIVSVLPRLSDRGLEELLQACLRSQRARWQMAEIANDEVRMRFMLRSKGKVA
ncbi:MAG TPA: hypothetical protein VGH38_10175 [Bryobacteraceae bacterium]